MKKRTILLITFFAIIAFIIKLEGISQAITVTPPPSATVGQNVTVTIRDSFTSGPTCAIDVDFGDGSPLVNAVPQGGCPLLPATCNATASHIYAAGKAYTITAKHRTGACLPLTPDPATASLTVSCPSLTITSFSPLSSATVGQTYSAQLTASGGYGTITYISQPLPPGLTLSSSGLISGTPTTTGNFSFIVEAQDQCVFYLPDDMHIHNTTDKAFSLLVNPAPCPVLSIASPSTLSTGTVGQGYSYQLHTSGGQAPVRFSVISGSLPSGLNLSTTASISGTPVTAGNYSFTVRATDSCGGGAQIADGAFSITINPITCPALSITTSSLSSGTAGTAYSAQILTSGGQAPVTFSVISGSLPSGLNLSTTGLISGTPTNQGNYSFTVAARDNCSAGAQSIQKAFSIQINSSVLSFSAIPSSSALPRGQSSSVTVGYRFTGVPSFGVTLNSSSGSFVVGGDTIDSNPVPLTVTIQNGSGSVSEVVNIPVRVIERTLQRNTNRFLYIRTFTGPDGTTLTVTTDFFITTEAAAGFDLKRIELYFENRRAEITVDRNYPALKAFADIRFVGSGLLQGFWEVDGRVLSTVNRHLTFAGSVTLQTPDLPPFPTFDPGSHVVRFVITSPVTEIPLPSIIYFVTSAEFEGKRFSIKLISPEDDSVLEYLPIKFGWEKLNTTTLFLIRFFDNPSSKPIFSAYAKDASYALPEIVFKKIFSPGQKYYWKVEGFDNENNNIGESDVHRFSFK